MMPGALTQTAVLRMFDVKLAVFKMKILGYWSKDGVPNLPDGHQSLSPSLSYAAHSGTTHV